MAVTACGGQPAASAPSQSAAAAKSSAPAATAAPSYPTRAITIISGYDASGTTSLVARMMAQYLSKQWNVPINIVNKPGGNTVPAQVDVYGSKPDGYTLYADNIGSTAILSITNPKLPFNIMDRTFIATISSNSMLLYDAPGSPLKTLKDVAADAQKDPSTFTWTGTGVAEIPARQFFQEAKVDMTKTKEVNSSGSGGGLQLGAQGSVKLAIAAVGPSIPLAQAGKIQPLAIASAKRWPDLPNVPTTAEAGFPDVQIVSWIGLSGPPGLPADVVQKWDSAIPGMLKDPAIQAQIKKFASVPDFRDSQAMKTEVGKELANVQALWKK
ncbi:MAG: tripartite tricarboxylate transporter substrate binding protein [Chloroflexota bacterium]|nr:tripartite tricarboxylate transporter substrate binding protein [Chloroflexota bacterium]